MKKGGTKTILHTSIDFIEGEFIHSVGKMFASTYCTSEINTKKN